MKLNGQWVVLEMEYELGKARAYFNFVMDDGVLPMFNYFTIRKCYKTPVPVFNNEAVGNFRIPVMLLRGYWHKDINARCYKKDCLGDDHNQGLGDTVRKFDKVKVVRSNLGLAKLIFKTQAILINQLIQPDRLLLNLNGP